MWSSCKCDITYIDLITFLQFISLSINVPRMVSIVVFLGSLLPVLCRLIHAVAVFLFPLTALRIIDGSTNITDKFSEFEIYSHHSESGIS